MDGKNNSGDIVSVFSDLFLGDNNDNRLGDDNAEGLKFISKLAHMFRDNSKQHLRISITSLMKTVILFLY